MNAQRKGASMRRLTDSSSSKRRTLLQPAQQQPQQLRSLLRSRPHSLLRIWQASPLLQRLQTTAAAVRPSLSSTWSWSPLATLSARPAQPTQTRRMRLRRPIGTRQRRATATPEQLWRGWRSLRRGSGSWTRAHGKERWVSEGGAETRFIDRSWRRDSPLVTVSAGRRDERPPGQVEVVDVGSDGHVVDGRWVEAG